MKRVTHSKSDGSALSGGGESSTKLFDSSLAAAEWVGRKPGFLGEPLRQSVTTSEGQRRTFLAGDLRYGPELRRLQAEIARHDAASEATLFVAGIHADSPFRTAQTAKARRELEDRGVIFVERPEDVDTPEKLAVWIETEYGTVPAAVNAALEPLAPVSVLKGNDLQPYLTPRPAEVAGDAYFLSHRRGGGSTKGPESK